MLENPPAPQPGFNHRVQEQGLSPSLKAFELLVGRAGARISSDDEFFKNKYTPEEVHRDIALSKELFTKFTDASKVEFRPSMLTEGIIKVGDKFELFGEGTEIKQASQFDDYTNNADFIVKVKNEIRDKKDERMLRPNERFVLDTTTAGGDRLAEKVEKLFGELRDGILTEVKYFPGSLSGGLRDVPRFVLEINEEELVEFFKNAKSSLDRAPGINEKRFGEVYTEFARLARKKILLNARAQVAYLAESARSISVPDEVSNQITTLLASPLGGFYQTLEYVESLNVSTLGLANEGAPKSLTLTRHDSAEAASNGLTRHDSAESKKKTARYFVMMKKILSVGVAIERSLEEKKTPTH
jgi:hypothetical protein